jgi:hypothetical protein
MPAIFALMPSKSEETYSRLFAQMRNMMPTVNPAIVLTDFESATVKAFHIHFLVSKHNTERLLFPLHTVSISQNTG